MSSDDDPKHRIRGNHGFGRLPTLRQAVIVAILIVVLFLFGTMLQQTGLWPGSWNATIDGTTE